MCSVTLCSRERAETRGEPISRKTHRDTRGVTVLGAVCRVLTSATRATKHDAPIRNRERGGTAGRGMPHSIGSSAHPVSRIIRLRGPVRVSRDGLCTVADWDCMPVSKSVTIRLRPSPSWSGRATTDLSRGGASSTTQYRKYSPLSLTAGGTRLHPTLQELQELLTFLRAVLVTRGLASPQHGPPNRPVREGSTSHGRPSPGPSPSG